MRRHAGDVHYSLGLADVTGTARVIAFWKMAARIMGKWLRLNALRMALAVDFGAGFVKSNLWRGHK
jgi:hypothetical protein